MPSSEHTTDVARFPRSPRIYITSLIGKCPALGVIAEKLDELPDAYRPDCECVLGEVFVRLLWLPRVTREQAEGILAHDADPGRIADEEIGILGSDPDKRPLLELWSWIWERETDDVIHAWARYCTALVARLYRFEPRALNESAACV